MPEDPALSTRTVGGSEAELTFPDPPLAMAAAMEPSTAEPATMKSTTTEAASVESAAKGAAPAETAKRTAATEPASKRAASKRARRCTHWGAAMPAAISSEAP